MKKMKFESLSEGKFASMEVEKMKRVLGGVNLPTYTVFGDGTPSRQDGTWDQDVAESRPQ